MLSLMSGDAATSTAVASAAAAVPMIAVSMVFCPMSLFWLASNDFTYHLGGRFFHQLW